MSHLTIQKEKVEDIIGLTHLQEGILYHYLQDSTMNPYFEQFCYTLKGRLDITVCIEAWNWTISNNEMLRTVFRWEKIQNPIQIVLTDQIISYQVHDLSMLKENEKLASLEEIRQLDRNQNFDLAKGPLIRVSFIKLEDERFVMMFSNHHIIFDGWSNGIILNEFIHAYSAFRSSRKIESQKKVEFKEYVKWLNMQDTLERDQFWSKYLEGYICKPMLITEDRYEKSQEGNTECVSHDLPKELVKELETLSKQVGVTMGTIYTTIWGVLLQYITGRDDILFGSTVSGRTENLPGIERIVGLLMNTVPVRLRLGNSVTLKDMLREMQQNLKDRQPFETTPLIRIRSIAGLKSKDVLFDTLLVIENYPLSINLNGEIHLEELNGYSVTNYPLLISINPFERTTFQFVFQTKYHSREKIELLIDRYIGLLKLLVTDRNCLIQDISGLTKSDKELEEVWDIEFDFGELS